jgi:protein-tyrosine kinase
VGSRSHEQHALLTDYENVTAYSQAFYTLFANIRFHRESEQTGISQVHTLAITSASAYQDQLTIAANLAIAAAQSGFETVLVDTDVHTSSMQQRFGLEPSAGLSDLLEEKTLTTQQITACLQQTFVPHLRVLGVGTLLKQSTALLLSPHLEAVTTAIREVVAASEKQPSIILYHCASVLSGPAASLVGALAEQTVLTVIMGETTRAQAKQAQEQLQQAHIKLAGVIMLHP